MRKKLFTFLLALAASVGMMNAAVDGKLPGAFSVSDTKVVYFSQGNLQYTKSTGKWKIMDHQYDVVETPSQNVGTDYASQDVITLFGWGTSGWDNTAADATSVHYQPYSTCKTIHNSNANINNYQYGPSNANVVGSSKAASAESWSKSDSYKNYDWGVFNSGDLGSGWRVLTTQEWGYLLGSTSPARTNAANLRTLATVNSVPGLIIMPDGWTASGVSLTVTTSKYTTNNINLTNWSTLEEQGCVFLPAAGYREGTSVMDNVGTRGFYWSSSAYSANYAYVLRFYTYSMGPQEINGRYDGCSVRLVSETAPTPEPSETTVTWDLSDMASMGTQGGYFKAKGITLMAYGVDNGMTGDGIYGGAYFGGPFVFTTSLGKFTKIEVTNSYLYDQPAFSGEGWTLDGTNAVWEGTPAALVSLVSNFGGITQIKFTIDPNTSTPANSCGDGLTWAVNDGVLTISYDGVGTGSMDNYDDPLSMPWYGQNITSVVLPEGLISIGQNAFAFINTFSQITLPSTLQYILMNAFSGCGLTSVTIPENVKGISASAFISSQSLATVTFEPTTPPRVGGNAFEYCHNDLIIYYPCESRAQYYNDMQADIAYYHDKMNNCPAVDPAVQNVIDLINAIPNPVVYNQQCSNALNAVYDAYVALSEEQRDQVTNYNDYLDAESTYYMLGSVNYVIETINEIGNVEFTSACKHRIDYARSEYCNLTLEAKGYVTNYNTLLAAEAAYAALIPVSSTVEWDEAILETIDADEWGEATYTNGSISLKAVDGRAHYVDIDDHFIFDGMNSEKSFVFSCTSANILCIEITVSEKHQHNELSCAWQETATGYRWVGEATSVDFASTIFKVTGIRFCLGEAFPEPTPTPAQDGDKLPGAFTVDGGKVVYFSKGNLQYLGNIERWHFAENQWTIIGNAQASDNRDLFSWGTGDNPDSEDYSTYTEWGNNIEGNWRTLTVEEWTYLFNTRTGASSKYGTATVAGVVGLILLPDVYDGTAINTERTAWNNNVISSSEWAAYEAKGAVFLPAAGLSDAFGVYGVGEQGFYWSSTMDELSHYAISVFYGFDGFEGYWFNQVDAQFQPQEGHSVRLVSETAPAPAPTPVTSYVVEFALGDAEGTAPTTVDVTIGEDITMPVNKTMYKAGYTLTGWSDGVNTYPIGESFTPANDVVLTPVFTANEADLLNASNDVTVKWYFGGGNGAPTTSYEGTSGLLVAQATIGDKTVDVKLAIDATSGKFAPQPDTEWAQVRVGTIFTYPYKEGMTVNVDTYSGNVTYYLADGNVTCGTNDYYSYIEVTYPASAPAPQPTTEEVITNEDPENPSYHYSTFFHSTQNYKLTNDGTQAFIADLSGNDLVLTKIAEGTQVIPMNTAVIFRKTGSADPVVLDPTDEAGVSFSANNDLEGVDDATMVTDIAGLTLENCYVLSGTNEYGVGFYKINGNQLKAHKAYVKYNGSQNNAPRRMRFVFNQEQVVTGIDNANADTKAEKRIENGQLIIIKNGVRYNAQGQIVR